MSTDKIIEKATEAMKAVPDANMQPQDELVLSKTCFTCGKSLVGIPRKNLRVCSKCELVAYCSAECLRKGWKNHSKHCNPENAEKVRAAARLRAKMAAEEERRRAADPQTAALAAVKAVHDTDEEAKKKKDGEAAAVAAAVQAALAGTADGDKKKAEGAEGAAAEGAGEGAAAAAEAKPLAVCGGETVVTTPEGCEQVSELAKKKLQALVGTGRATGMHALIGLRNETRTLVQEGVDAKATIVVQNCEHCKFEVACLCTKIFMMSCADVEITVPREGKVVSATFEAYTCRQIDVRTDTPLMTVQLDACTDFNIEFLHKECYRMVVWAGCENLTVGVRHATLAAADASASSVARKAPAAEEAAAAGTPAEWTVKTGMTEMRKEFQNLRADIDQFKIHFVGDRLLNERVVRLNNGFPTTQREADDYDRRQELNMQKLAETMGITIKRKPREPNKVRVKRNDLCPCGSGKRAKNCCYP